MNVKNNKRRRESVEKIEKAFMELLVNRELKEIYVSDICKLTGINRSTFYANFEDVYDLADKIKEKLEEEFSELFENYDTENNYFGAITMFRHIKDNQLFYKTYFKLGYDENHPVMIYDLERAKKHFDVKYVDYHIEFFRHGINAIIKMWLSGGCKESPEEMEEILKQEYLGRKKV